MEELEEAGWKASGKQNEEGISDHEIQAMFEEADIERRNSEVLAVVPRKVPRKVNRKTVAKITGLAGFASIVKRGFMTVDREKK